MQQGCLKLTDVVVSSFFFFLPIHMDSISPYDKKWELIFSICSLPDIGPQVFLVASQTA